MCRQQTRVGGGRGVIVLPQRAATPLLVYQNCCDTLYLISGRSKRSFLHPECTWGVLVVCGYHSCLLARFWVGVLHGSFYVAFECILACRNFKWGVSSPTERSPAAPSSLLRLQHIRFNQRQFVLLHTTGEIDLQWRWQGWCTALFYV